MSKNTEDPARLEVENAALRHRVAGLELEAQRFKATLYSIGDAVIATDAASVIVQMNPVAETLTGWSEADARGRPAEEVFNIVNEKTDAKVESPVTRVLREGLVVGLANHTVLVARDGTRRPIADSGAPIRNEKGEMMGVVLVFRDQTAERLAQKAIEESEARFRTVFEGSPLGKSMTGVDGRLSVNRAFCELLGYSQEELATRKWQELTHPDDVEESARIVQSLLDGSTAHAHYEKRYVHKSRKVIWADVNTTLARDAEGNPLFFITTISDITERVRVEKTLRESEARYRTLVENIPQKILMKDRNYRWVSINEALARDFGIRPEEVVGKMDVDLFMPELAAKYHADDVRIMETGKTEELEERYLLEGRETWVNTIKAPVRDTNGEIVGVLGVFWDITERKRTEAISKQEQALSNTIIDSIPGTFYMLNGAGRYVRWNAYQRDEIVGKPDDMVASTNALDTIHPDDRELIQSRIANVLTTGADETVEGRVLLRGGPAFRWLLMTGRRLLIDDHPFLIGIGVDITERKRAEAEIGVLNAELEGRVGERTKQLEESNKELEAFSYSVSHDLRAPLRAIDGFARILSDDYAPKLDDEATRVCLIIRDNATKMGRLIDDLLTFSRLGRAEMQPSSIDMGGMARAIFHEVTTPEHRARIDFQLEALPLAVGDPSLMRQVWTNLLSNALKFSSKRERSVITISGETKDGEDIFVMHDNGAGFDMQYVSKLFGVFQRLHSTREFEGTGVGLALVQRVIRRHGGRIWAQGEINHGATFSFALPHKGT